jgi:hypothetical protein
MEDILPYCIFSTRSYNLILYNPNWQQVGAESKSKGRVEMYYKPCADQRFIKILQYCLADGIIWNSDADLPPFCIPCGRTMLYALFRKLLGCR